MNPIPNSFNRRCTNHAYLSLVLVLAFCAVGTLYLFATELLPELLSEKRSPWPDTGEVVV